MKANQTIQASIGISLSSRTTWDFLIKVRDSIILFWNGWSSDKSAESGTEVSISILFQ